MSTDVARDIVARFIAQINAHDIERLYDSMTEDHCFTDSAGVVVRGREEMKRAWTAYLHMIPDFFIEAERYFVDGPAVAVFGRSRGTFSPDGTLPHKNRWEIPSAWRAVVRDGRVAEWQVYADNEPVRMLISPNG